LSGLLVACQLNRSHLRNTSDTTTAAAAAAAATATAATTTTSITATNATMIATHSAALSCACQEKKKNICAFALLLEISSHPPLVRLL
jgi:hypothetical protein